MKTNIKKFGLAASVLVVLTLVILFAVVIPVEASPDTLYVDDDRDDDWYKDPANFKVIQEAIDAAAKSGDTIIVYPGTYTDCLTIIDKKSLTLQSQEKGKAIIDVKGNECDAIQVDANSVVIEGFTICNAPKDKCGIRASSGSALVFRSNMLRYCGRGIGLGIEFKGGKDIFVETNAFESNDYGILWASGGNVVIRNNTFTNNNFAGIYINEFRKSLKGFQVIGNELSGNNPGILWTFVKGTKGEGRTIPLVQYNNIYKNTGGVSNTGGVMDATHNWWGHPSGPYHSSLNPYGKGDEASDGVNFEPWLLSTWETTDTVYTRTDMLSKENKSIDIPDVVEATAEQGEGIVTVGQYIENPGTEIFSGNTGSYVDVHITPEEKGSSIEELVIKLFYDEGVIESSLEIYWWDGSDWEQCSDTGVDTAANFIWARIAGNTKPNLSDLTGTPFVSRDYREREASGKAYPSREVGGEVYPINKVVLIAPWLALAAAIVAGGIVLVRRRVHSYR